MSSTSRLTPRRSLHVVTKGLLVSTFVVGLLAAIGIRASHTPIGAFTKGSDGKPVAMTLTAEYVSGLGKLADIGAVWTVVLLAAAVAIAFLVSKRNFVIGWLCAFAPVLLVWRIAAMQGLTAATQEAKPNFINGWSGAFSDGVGAWKVYLDRPWFLMLLCAATSIAFIVEFGVAWKRDVTFRQDNRWLMHLIWGATLVRIYFGFNEVGHTVEKIFASKATSNGHAGGFELMGNATVAPFNLVGEHPLAFMIAAGIIELALMLGLGLGFMTRLAGIGGVAYVLLASLAYGGEFGNGYAGFMNGFELPLLVIAVFSAFALTGAGPFSVDYQLAKAGKMPKWMRPLCLPKHAEISEELSPRV